MSDRIIELLNEITRIKEENNKITFLLNASEGDNAGYRILNQRLKKQKESLEDEIKFLGHKNREQDAHYSVLMDEYNNLQKKLKELTK